MGCDISIYIELDTCTDSTKSPFSGNATSIGEGEVLSIDRDYALFAAIANVRNNGSIQCHVEPRGIPNNLSCELIPQFYQPIKEELGAIPSNFWYSWKESEAVWRKEAKKLVAKGVASYNQEIEDCFKPKQLISNTYAHTFSWLYLDEILKSIKINNLEIRDENLLLVLDLMKAIEKRKGERRTRMLFYFYG